MATISDYLDWRGDIHFLVSPFNEVDNYIVAKIGTADLHGIVPETAEAVPLEAALERYFRRFGQGGNYLGLLSSEHLVPILRRLPETVRFRELALSGYVNRVLPQLTEQFAALTVTLPDGNYYVSFRGTDDTIAAWKEDFMLSLEDAVPAQRDAAAYLAWAAEQYPGPLIVGGHSKGGNLAVYAAATAAPAVQDRIVAVFNNDGPGFAEEFLRSEGYLRIRDRIVTLLPQRSIVGTLLSQDRYTVVRCSRAGFSAHDGFNWEVRGTAFVHAPQLSRSSMALDESLERVLQGMELQERREFIETFFDLLTASGAVTLTDINEHKLRKAVEFGKGIRREKKVQRFAVEAMELTLKRYVALLAAQGKTRVRGRLPGRKKGDEQGG